MTLDAFAQSLSGTTPPAGLSDALNALWWAGRKDWDRAHKIAQAHEGTSCDWVHAYLHRVEGDLPNARYWYRAAQKREATGALDIEWRAIASDLLSA